MKDILLVGGGGHCRSCIDVLEKDNKFRIVGIVDGQLHANQQRDVLGYPIFGGDEDLSKLRRSIQYAFVSIGQIKTPIPRQRIYQILKNLDFTLPSIISPLAYVSKDVLIGEGSIVMHHALLNRSAKIGKMCIINSKALVEHDSEIQDFCHISTGAIVNGNCKIEESSFVGSNTSIRHQQIIFKNSIVYNGGGGWQITPF